MNTPKFTAEASRYNQNLHYQATTDPGVGGGVVQPASPFSSATYSNRPVPVFSFFSSIPRSADFLSSHLVPFW